MGESVFVLHDNDKDVVKGVFSSIELLRLAIKKLGGDTPAKGAQVGPAGTRGRFVAQQFRLDQIADYGFVGETKLNLGETMKSIVKVSELKTMIKEAVKTALAEKARLAECGMDEKEENLEEALLEFQTMIDKTIKEAFGEKGDSNGAHVGGTFGDGGKEKDPLAGAEKIDEAKKKKDAEAKKKVVKESEKSEKKDDKRAEFLKKIKDKKKKD